MIDAATAYSGFSVRDTAEAAAFYSGVLGLTVTEVHGMLRIDIGDEHSVLVYPKGRAHVPAEFTVLNFPVADVDGTVEELTRAGVEFVQYPGTTDAKGINRHGGPLIAWFTDPSGNLFSIVAQD